MVGLVNRVSVAVICDCGIFLVVFVAVFAVVAIIGRVVVRIFHLVIVVLVLVVIYNPGTIAPSKSQTSG